MRMHFMNRTFLPLISILFLFFATAPFARADFTDVPRTHSSYTAVAYLQNEGVIGGYPDGTFQPNNVLNRVESLKIILSSINVEYSGNIFSTGCPDVPLDAWFAPIVVQAQKMGIMKGNADGTCAPANKVTLAAFIKMLLEANTFNEDRWKKDNDEWFSPYMRFAETTGLIESGLDPASDVSRARAAEILYLLSFIRNATNVPFLIERAQAEIAQIDVYLAAHDMNHAKGASDLAVDATQQAMLVNSNNPSVLGAAKVARAYNLLVQAYILLFNKDTAAAAEQANAAMAKAGEAYDADNATQPIDKHIKDLAREVLNHATE